MISLIGILAYIVYTEILFYSWRLWWLIADIAIILIVLYAVTLALVALRQHEQLRA